MLSTKEFHEYAKEVVPFLHVTSRIEGDKYQDLLREKGGQGFPYLVAMDAEGAVIAQVPWKQRTVAGFRDTMKRGAQYQALLAKKDRTAAEELALIKADLGMHRLEPADARARAEALKGLDAAGTKERDGMLLCLEIAEKAKSVKRGDTAGAIAAGEAFAKMWKSDREPDGDADEFQPFFILMLDYAESVPDAALFERALGKLHAKFGSEPAAATFLKKQDERLAKLKEAK